MNYSYKQLVDDYVSKSTSPKYRLSTIMNAFDKATHSFQSLTESIYDALSRDDLHVDDGTISLPVLIRGDYHYVAFNAADIAYAYQATPATEIYGIDLTANGERKSFLADEVCKAHVAQMETLEATATSMDLISQNSNDFNRILTAISSYRDNAMRKFSGYALDYLSSIIQNLSLRANDIESAYAAVWAAAGISRLIDVQEKEGEDLFASSLTYQIDDFCGIPPMVLFAGDVDAIMGSLSELRSKAIQFAFLSVSYVLAVSSYALIKGLTLYVKAGMALFNLIDTWINGDNLVVNNGRPDDLSIDFAGNSYHIEDLSPMWSLLWEVVPQELETELLSHVEDRKLTAVVIPGATIYAYVTEVRDGKPIDLHIVVRKHLTARNIARRMSNMFGFGSSHTPEDMQAKFQCLYATRAAVLTYEPEGTVRNWDNARALYETELGLAHSMAAFCGDEFYDEWITIGPHASFVTKSIVDGTPLSECTNEQMASSVSSSLTFEQAKLAFRALGTCFDPKSPYIAATLQGPLSGMYTVPSDKATYTMYKNGFKAAAGVVATVATVAAIVYISTRIKVFLRGKAGQYWGQYTKLSQNPSATADQIGTAYGKYVFYSNLVGMPVNGSNAAFAGLFTKQDGENLEQSIPNDFGELSSKIDRVAESIKPIG